MANRRFIDFPIATTVGDNDIVLIWQDGANKQTTKATFLSGLPENLEDLNDVVISGLTNGQILRYDSITGKWENTDQGNLDLNDLNDVSIVSPSNGQVLVYNSSTSKWENSSGGFVPYVGAVTTVDLGAQGLRAGYVRFDTSVVAVPDEQGLMYWDASRSTAALIMNGTLQHIGQDSFFYVKNSSGSTIPKGTCVGFAGTEGASGHLLITPFLANGSVPSTYFMGVTCESIANGAFGQVMHFGELEGINTSGFTAGALLYASTTVAGAFQTTPPVAPNNIILVAAAVNSKNNGAIVVRPTLGSNFNTNESVKLTSVANLDLLQYQSGTGVWENKTLAQVIGSAYVPSTRTLTINGVSQDLSANRTFNVGTVTSVGLSSATSGVTIGSTPVTSSGTITLAIATASGSQQGLLSAADWTTFNNKQNALTNPVTGTGTTNRLAKFTGASTIGNSNISDGGITIFNENPVAGQFAWQFNGNTTTGLSFGASVVAGTNSSDIAFRVLNAAASSNYFVVRGDGNVGIGVTPSAWGSTVRALQFENGASIASNQSTQVSFNNNVYAIPGTNDFYIANGFASRYIQFQGQHSWLTAPSGTAGNAISFTQAMTLNASGNLGLGVTPSAWGSSWKSLDISNVSSLASQSTVTRLYHNGYNDNSSNIYKTSAAASMYSQDGGAHQWFQAPSGTAGNAISFTQAMTLNASGNLLVGTTSDNGARLQVSGTAYFSSNVRINGNDLDLNNGSVLHRITNDNTNLLIRADYGNDSPNSTIQFSIDGTTRMLLNSSGNVGIGTTSPDSRLHVGLANNNQLRINYLSTGDNYYDAVTHYFRNGGGASNVMMLTNGGNVLIGTTTDNGARLQVSGVSRFNAGTSSDFAIVIDSNSNFAFGSTNGRRTGTITRNSGDKPGLQFGYDATDNTGILAGATESLGAGIDFYTYNGSSWGNRLRIASTGAATFSSSVTAANFAVGAASNFNAMFYTVGAVASYIQLANGSTGANSANGMLLGVDGSGNGIVNVRGAVDYITSVAGLERFRITSSGNVGIGTPSPLAFGGLTTLSINGNVGALGLMNNGSNVFLLYNDGSNTLLNSVSNTGLVFGTNNTERMRITSGGNLLVGTTSDNGARLQVSGTSTFSDNINTNRGNDRANILFNTTAGVFRWGMGLINTETGSNVGGDFTLFRYNDNGSFNNFALTVNRASGNVVIGNTVASNVGLTIFGSNAATIYQTSNTGTGAGNGFYVGHTGDISYVWNYNNFPLVLATNNTERMRITAGGNVLIGTTTDNGARLQVNGGANINGTVLGNQFLTVSGTVSNPFNVWTTMFTIPSGTVGRYELIVVSQGNGGVYTSQATIVANNNFVGIRNYTDGGALAIQASGFDIQCRNGSGSTLSIRYKYIRID